MNKAEVELEIKTINDFIRMSIEYGGGKCEGEVKPLCEAIAAYMNRRIKTERGFAKLAFTIEVNDGIPKISILAHSNEKGVVYM